MATPRNKAPRKRKKAAAKVKPPETPPAPPLQIVSYHPMTLPHTTCPHCHSGWSRIYKTGKETPIMRYHECDRKHKYRSRQV